jgi:spoIIIJ-associated protein
MVDHLGWDLAVRVEEADPETIRVDLSGEDRDLVLCNRAEVLEALQYLLNRTFGRENREAQRILVDCDGYRARKEAELREIALRVSERVRRTGAREELGLMNPYERRIVHLTVAETEGVTTVSAGDGVMKRVIILPA